jgi:acyl-CoA reductase-like NAD-dependent aldehyde dehydrogenase
MVSYVPDPDKLLILVPTLTRFGIPYLTQTASVWTNIENQESADAFNMFSSELEAGTVFLNRCDCPDPALSWTGVKNSGRGVSLSTFGQSRLHFERLEVFLGA